LSRGRRWMCTDPMTTMSLYDEGARHKAHGAREPEFSEVAVFTVNPEPCALDHFAYPKVRKSKKREGTSDD
jgi:hypothetical protein